MTNLLIRHPRVVRFAALPLLVAALSLPANAAEPAAAAGALAKMPVKELTVFKDGHALVLHAGRMPTDDKGNVVMDYLPTPVFGTFWPYSAEKDAKLSATVASTRKVPFERTALNLQELIQANAGAEVVVTEAPAGAGDAAKPLVYPATIVRVPEQTGEELEATSPPNAGPVLGQKAAFVLLKTADGVKAVPIERIVDVTFKNPHNAKLAREEFRNLLTLKLDWPDGAKPRPQADVGMMYVQKGVRWIPSYKVSLDGKGEATVRLQATLLNELTDLEDVTAHLVIGVPSFAFAGINDPMALQATIVRLSQHFEPDARTGNYLSNSMQTQVMSNPDAPARAGGGAGAAADLGPEVGGSSKSEDLFIFTVSHVTLKKGQRMVIPVAEVKVPYEDVYTLTVPFAPPPEVWRGFDANQRAEVARLIAQPKVMHKVRLTNRGGKTPFTTAPALIAMGDRVLSQGMMYYTAPGASTDLELTTAVDVRVRKEEKETKRTPNAEVWQNDRFVRVDLEGSLTLTQFGEKPIKVEVTRDVLGNVGKADQGGTAVSLNLLEEAQDAVVVSASGRPGWWGWYNWPTWWRHLNGMGRITWDVQLEPQKPIEMRYSWHYYWR